MKSCANSQISIAFKRPSSLVYLSSSITAEAKVSVEAQLLYSIMATTSTINAAFDICWAAWYHAYQWIMIISYCRASMMRNVRRRRALHEYRHKKSSRHADVRLSPMVRDLNESPWWRLIFVARSSVKYRDTIHIGHDAAVSRSVSALMKHLTPALLWNFKIYR